MADHDTATTAEGLVLLLAAAGEIDAGVEVLEALRVRDGGSSNVLRLQARLFLADEPTAEQRQVQLEHLRGGFADALARGGALLEAGVALRVLAAAFPDEPGWSDKLWRVDEVLQPLPDGHLDPRRAQADALVALGRSLEAWEIVRDLATERPTDGALARRSEALRTLLFEPLSLRPRVPEAWLPGAAAEAPEPSTVTAERTVTPVVPPLADEPAPEDTTHRRASLPDPATSTVEIKRRKIVVLG